MVCASVVVVYAMNTFNFDDYLDEPVGITTIVNEDGTPITFRQLIGEPNLRARDEGYINCFYPLVFYFSEEMRETQRRVAEAHVLTLSHHEHDVRIQLIVNSLQLDLTRERDDIDLALMRGFSNGSVLTVKFDDTPLLLSSGFHFAGDGDEQYRHLDFVGNLVAGTHVRFKTLSEHSPFGLIMTPTDTSEPIRVWHRVEVLCGEYVGRWGWIPNFLLEPNS
jgi:hypothetical protein